MKKKIFALAVMAATLAVVAVGGSMAYLQAATDPKNNVFTASANISLKLAEPKWDGYTFSDLHRLDLVVPPQEDSQEEPRANPDYVGEPLGIELASRYVPGDVIPKDPRVQNTSGHDVYVAMKVSYYGWDSVNEKDVKMSYSEFQEEYGSITFNLAEENGWKEIQNGLESKSLDNEFFIYKSKLNAKTETGFSETAELFDKIVMADRENAVDEMGSQFKVVLTAYAVIAEGTEALDENEVPIYQNELLKIAYVK